MEENSSTNLDFKLRYGGRSTLVGRRVKISLQSQKLILKAYGGGGRSTFSRPTGHSATDLDFKLKLNSPTDLDFKLELNSATELGLETDVGRKGVKSTDGSTPPTDSKVNFGKNHPKNSQPHISTCIFLPKPKS